MYKQDSELNNLQRLICHKTKPNQLSIYIYQNLIFQVSPFSLMAKVSDCGFEVS